MSNIVMREDLNYASRAMLAGAMIGGAASIANQWQASQQGSITADAYMKKVATDTLKAGVVSAVSTYTAGKMVGQPVLSLATILAVGVAGACLLSNQSQGNEDE